MLNKIVVLTALFLSVNNLGSNLQAKQKVVFASNLATSGTALFNRLLAPETNFDNERKDSRQLVRCLTDDVPRPEGVSAEIDHNSLVAQPTTFAEFQEWIGGLLGSQILVSRISKDFYVEGDFNNDGCKDIAVVIEPDTDYAVISRPDDPNDKPRTNRNFDEYIKSFVSCDTEVINLETNFSAYPCEDKNGIRKLSTTSKFALLLVNGGSQGWSWNVGGKGRTHILLGAIPNQAIGRKSIRLSVIEKGVNHENVRLLKNAAGNNIYITATTASKMSKGAFVIAKRMIYFNNQNYAAQKLPDVIGKK